MRSIRRRRILLLMMINSETTNNEKETNYQLVHKNLMTTAADTAGLYQRNLYSSPSSLPPFSFKLPPELTAKEPPERRSTPRDGQIDGYKPKKL